MKLAVLLLAFSSVALAANLQHWENDYDGPLNFQCHDDEYAVTSVKSQHNNYREDRRFEFSCAKVVNGGTGARCRWTNYVNSYDALVHFACPGNQYVNGMRSVHDNHYEDRIWKYRCCSLTAIDLMDCELTGWTNSWDQVQNYNVPTDFVVKGVISMHNNHREDRLFEFFICRAVKKADVTAKPKHLLEFLLIGQEGMNDQGESIYQEGDPELAEKMEYQEEMEQSEEME